MTIIIKINIALWNVSYHPPMLTDRLELQWQTQIRNKAKTKKEHIIVFL